MVNLRIRSLMAALLCSAVLIAGPAGAADSISLDAAVAAAQQRHQARVVRAETAESGGRKVYVLRLLNDAGKVWTIRIDAASGMEISQ